MKELLEQGFGIAVIGIVAGIGVIIRVILFGYYGTLSKACKRLEYTKNKTVAYIKKDLKRRAESGQEIKNVVTYTECRLAECKVGGVHVGSWECMMQYSVLLLVLSGVLSALAGVLTECGYRFALGMLFCCGTTVMGLVVFDLVAGLREKNRRIRLCIRDYIENDRVACMAEETELRTETAEPELHEKRKSRKEKKAEQRVEKKSRRAEKKAEREARKCRKVDKPKKAGKNGKAQEEKRRLTEELLRERRQLEARSFAEQRKKEREEEESVQQLHAEAAVTECVEPIISEEVKMPVQEVSEPVVEEVSEAKSQEFSYEMLLSEVLAEYLA